MSVRGLSESRGFTLIELVMIIVVIGILAAVAVPKYANISSDAQQATCHGKQGSIHAAISIYYATHHGLPDSLETGMFVSGTLPVCPGSGTVTYTAAGDTSYSLTCSQHGAPAY